MRGQALAESTVGRMHYKPGAKARTTVEMDGLEVKLCIWKCCSKNKGRVCTIIKDTFNKLRKSSTDTSSDWDRDCSNAAISERLFWQDRQVRPPGVELTPRGKVQECEKKESSCYLRESMPWGKWWQYLYCCVKYFCIREQNASYILLSSGALHKVNTKPFIASMFCRSQWAHT